MVELSTCVAEQQQLLRLACLHGADLLTNYVPDSEMLQFMIDLLGAKDSIVVDDVM
jgi:hypothetical protein